MSASANTTTTKQCATCNKSNGILICDGCKKNFCGKHVIEHRQELGVQLDNIMQEHDLLQHDIEQISIDQLTLQKIDSWEKTSIAKIRSAADNARKNLQKVLDQSKERILKVCQETAINLRTSREADDYSENDFSRWNEQLNNLKSAIKSASLIKITENKRSVIRLITIESNDINNKTVTNDKQSLLSTKTQEKFLETCGPVIIENEGLLIRHNGSSTNFACIRGRFLYSKGCYLIRFKIEQSQQPYQIFFGCMSSKGTLKEKSFKSQHAVGWFGFDQVYEHGRCTTNCQKYGYQSHIILNDDILHLTIDCDNRQIRLYHERKQTTCTLSIDEKLAPFPWQYLVVLCNPGDSVRILPNM